MVVPSVVVVEELKVGKSVGVFGGCSVVVAVVSTLGFSLELKMGL